MKIKQPNESLLEGAMKILADQLGGQVVATINDSGGNVDVDFGVVAPGVRGWGVNIKDGALEVVGDDGGQRIRLAEFRNSLNQAYKQCLSSSLWGGGGTALRSRCSRRVLRARVKIIK